MTRVLLASLLLSAVVCGQYYRTPAFNPPTQNAFPAGTCSLDGLAPIFDPGAVPNPFAPVPQIVTWLDAPASNPITVTSTFAADDTVTVRFAWPNIPLVWSGWPIDHVPGFGPQTDVYTLYLWTTTANTLPVPTIYGTFQNPDPLQTFTLQCEVSNDPAEFGICSGTIGSCTTVTGYVSPLGAGAFTPLRGTTWHFQVRLDAGKNTGVPGDDPPVAEWGHWGTVTIP